MSQNIFEIDLNAPGALSTNSVSLLLASKNDSKATQIRVTKSGIVFLSEDVGSDNLDGILFRLETFDAGNGYVGQSAASDTEWTKKIYQTLKENWPNPRNSYIDYY